MNWTGNGNATLNKTDGDMTFSVDETPYMQVDQSGSEVDFFKGIKLNDPERSIDVNAGQRGKLKYSGSSRLTWGTDKVEVLTDMSVSGELLLSSEDRAINSAFGVAGKLQYGGANRLTWGNNQASSTGIFRIADGTAGGDGSAVVGLLDMNNKVLKNLPEPTQSHHAATKNYVDNPPAAPVPQATPAGIVLFQYRPDLTVSQLQGSHNSFNLTEPDPTTKEFQIRISCYSNGIFYGPPNSTPTIRTLGPTWWQICEFDGAYVIGGMTEQWTFMKQSGGKYYNQLECRSRVTGLESHAFVQGRWYVLQLPAPFPIISYSRDVMLNGPVAFSIPEEEELEDSSE